MMKDTPERLSRWMLYHKQPEGLALEHHAQIDIAWAADRIALLTAINKELLEALTALINRINHNACNLEDLPDTLRNDLINQARKAIAHAERESP